jgi:predicted naringenin-chalcone synthase
VLSNYGNMSSATLIFVFERMRNRLRAKGSLPVKNNDPSVSRKGRWVPALAFGPGLTVEGALLRACF